MQTLVSLQVFKEEEEALKVDLHEGCGRAKLFWIMALADSSTLKAMLEFRNLDAQPGQPGQLLTGSAGALMGASSVSTSVFGSGAHAGGNGGNGCRFCGAADVPVINGVCGDKV